MPQTWDSTYDGGDPRGQLFRKRRALPLELWAGDATDNVAMFTAAPAAALTGGVGRGYDLIHIIQTHQR